MSIRRAAFAALFLVIALFGIGCWDDGIFDPDERIIFQNRSGIDGVNCYIDDVLKGTVDSGEDVGFDGEYDGDRVLRASGGGRVWGPVTQHMANGMTFVFELR